MRGLHSSPSGRALSQSDSAMLLPTYHSPPSGFDSPSGNIIIRTASRARVITPPLTPGTLTPGTQRRLFAINNPPRTRNAWFRVVYLWVLFAIFLLVGLATWWQLHKSGNSSALSTTSPSWARGTKSPRESVAGAQKEAAVGKEPSSVKQGTFALILYGSMFHDLNAFSGRAGGTLKRYVLSPISPDVFVCGDLTSFSREELRGFVPNIVDLHEEPEWGQEQILHTFASTTTGRKIDGHILGVQNLMAMRWMQVGYERVKAYEKAHGFEYERIIFMRPDMEWFAPHPSLDVLNPEWIWFPSAVTLPGNLGKNTGHLLLHEIICSRQHCDLVGNLFNRLTDGSFFDSLKKDSRGCGDPCTIDRFLALYFREHNVHVGMYRNVAGVICSSVTCPPGQKYLFNDESNDFEATKAMMWALTVKLKGWLPSLVWKFENVGNEAESAL